jgi:chemotaxis response regulator CheB
MGIKAIKEQGGTTIAQDPETAEHNSMPRSAIATGMVDFILTLEEIGPAITTLITKGDVE